MIILDSDLLFGPPCRLDRFWTNQELMYDYKSSLPE